MTMAKIKQNLKHIPIFLMKNKNEKIFLLFTLIFVICIGVCRADDVAIEGNTEASAVVVYVPGWQSGTTNTFEREKKFLAELFAPSSVEVFVWEESNISYFPKCCQKIDEDVAERLTMYLLNKYSDDELQNVILIGHSLGGRMVIRSMAQLCGYKKKIRLGIFLGSAISYDDPDIKIALMSSGEKSINVFSKDDPVLKKWYGINNDENALGAYGYKIISDNVRQFQGKITDHSSWEYFRFLEIVLSSKVKEYKRSPDIEVLYGMPYSVKSYVEKNPRENVQNWLLVQENEEIFYIVDPDDRIRARGNEQRMREAFDHIHKQLDPIKNYADQ